jgi:hypothetical protein
MLLVIATPRPVVSDVSPRTLPVLAIVRYAFALPWRHRREVFRTTGLPLLSLVAVSLLWEFLSWRQGFLMQWLSHLVYLFAFSWVATTVHRLVLLDEASASVQFSLQSWRRVGVYFLAFAFLMVMFLAVKFILFNGIGLATGITYVPTGTEPKVVARRWLDWGTSIVALVAIARFVLVLPSIAVDQGHDLKQSWRSSQGNTWRLVVVYAVLPWALEWCRWLLYRDGASTFEFALIVVLACLCAVVEVIALSLSYGALTAPAPPPTVPHA